MVGKVRYTGNVKLLFGMVKRYGMLCIQDLVYDNA